MAALGRLTRSAMLYEGNWVEWDDRVFNQMEMSKAGSGKEFRVPGSDPWGLERMGLRDPMANSICKQVSPAMLERVPQKDRGHLERLLRNLKALARPFRLNDLPPELRARIFQFHFGLVKRYIIHGSGIKDETRQSRSNLLLVSKATMIQALPLFLGAAEICFYDPTYAICPSVNTTVEAFIHSWVHSHVKDNAKYLRRMAVFTKLQGNWGEVRVRLDLKTGLELDLPPNLSTHQERRWVDPVKKIEEGRRALGLQGEAVVLALTTKARM
ncbi:hypothetical protein LTR56_011112 [Elasticomyces elasticus]|nr:hypothetical protein LTR56_011112 [Elasticomyces elasticus]KAK3662467.1 hypothetical protein LTR22_006746 [Elasticomyces elasticus]KAK4926456.1 hypothetical protein LTR49_006663 [Elasticomyces elasticus]KAK5761170.1 hypothetical protein LTS12_008651 [Elasticomyces elasticus]